MQILKSLIFGDVADCTHRAFLEAISASNAVILVHDSNCTARNFKDALRAGINADSACHAFILKDDRMSHLFLLVSNPFIENARVISKPHTLNPMISTAQDTIR